LLRLSGNFSSGYRWRDGIGLRLMRPTRANPAWAGVEPNHFGTDDFLRFSQLIGAVPHIGVNAGNGTPEEAAAWVRYVNGSKFRVPIWEIGNELYGGWQIGHTDAKGNAERFVRFRAAMLEADPRIKIIATGKGDELLPEGLKRNREWNEAVLRAAEANGGKLPQWISIHPLVSLPGDLAGNSYAEQYESAMAHPAFVDNTLLPSLIQTIHDVQGPQARTRIAPTEWGIIIGGDRWWQSPNHDVMAGAIFNALTLNAFLRHSDWVTLANMTALMHGGGIKKPNGVVIVDPQYYTQQLYAMAQPRVPVETTWSGPGRDVPRRGFLPAVPNVPDVDVFSALNADRSKLHAFVVNRNLNAERPVRFNVNGFAARSVSATVLTASSAQAHNTWEKPDTVTPRPFALPKATGRGAWMVSLPPHSLVVFTFEANTR
jgi:alpha-N-arabinofuranosidase